MDRKPIAELHCARCGGFIIELRHISYQPAPTAGGAAPLNGDLCACAPPIVFGPPPGYMTSPAIPIPRRPSA